MATADSTVTYKDIAGFPGYRVGDDGSVWGKRGSGFASGTLSPAWRRMKPAPAGRCRRYQDVNLYRDGRSCHRLVHRLVLEAFVGLRPDGMQCRHLDGNPANNNLRNLAWGTPAKNQHDRVTHGTDNRGEKHGVSKLTDAQVEALFPRLDAGESRAKIAREVGVNRSVIVDIASGDTYRHLRPEGWAPRKRLLACEAAVQILRETQNAAVMYGDATLLHLIAKRAGLKAAGRDTERRVLKLLSMSPGILVPKKTRLGNGRLVRIFRLPEEA
jgi:hypothetical protein